MDFYELFPPSRSLRAAESPHLSNFLTGLDDFGLYNGHRREVLGDHRE